MCALDTNGLMVIYSSGLGEKVGAYQINLSSRDDTAGSEAILQHM